MHHGEVYSFWNSLLHYRRKPATFDRDLVSNRIVCEGVYLRSLVERTTTIYTGLERPKVKVLIAIRTDSEPRIIWVVQISDELSVIFLPICGEVR